MRWVQPGAEVAAGASICTHRGEDGQLCDQPPIAHAFLTIVPPVSALLCKEHWEVIASIRRPVDAHRFGGACNIPGSVWVPSRADQRGGCTIPLTNTDELHEHTNQPEGARP